MHTLMQLFDLITIISELHQSTHHNFMHHMGHAALGTFQKGYIHRWYYQGKSTETRPMEEMGIN